MLPVRAAASSPVPPHRLSAGVTDMKFRVCAAMVATLFCLLSLLLFPDTGTQAAHDALVLCAQTVIPSLFPFFVLSSLLISCGASEVLASLLAPLMRPLFGLSGAGAAALALGLCGGYPVGARTAAELTESGVLPREEGERLLLFCNNAGPGFLLGICGGAVFASPRAGAALYLIHVASALFTGMLLTRRLPPLHPSRTVSSAKQEHVPLSAAFPAAVQGALAGILNVCAFVVIFQVLTCLFLRALPAQLLSSLPCALLVGFFELTNGVMTLPNTRAGFLACTVLLAWGGLSVHCQTLGTLGKSGLSARYYLRGKAVQALLSLILSLPALPFLFP